MEILLQSSPASCAYDCSVQWTASSGGRVATEAVSAWSWGLEHVAAQVTEGTLSVAGGVGGMEGSCLGKGGVVMRGQVGHHLLQSHHNHACSAMNVFFADDYVYSYTADDGDAASVKVT